MITFYPEKGTTLSKDILKPLSNVLTLMEAEKISYGKFEFLNRGKILNEIKIKNNKKEYGYISVSEHSTYDGKLDEFHFSGPEGSDLVGLKLRKYVTISMNKITVVINKLTNEVLYAGVSSKKAAKNINTYLINFLEHVYKNFNDKSKVSKKFYNPLADWLESTKNTKMDSLPELTWKK